MRSYNRITQKGSIRVNNSYAGEPLEVQIRKILQNSEPIDNTAPIIYTNRADGVQPAYDIRADRFDIAIEAMDVVSKTRLAKREEFAKMDVSKGGNEKGGETPANTSDTSLKIV